MRGGRARGGEREGDEREKDESEGDKREGEERPQRSARFASSPCPSPCRSRIWEQLKPPVSLHSQCGRPFHHTCLLEWLRAIPGHRQSFGAFSLNKTLVLSSCALRLFALLAACLLHLSVHLSVRTLLSLPAVVSERGRVLAVPLG